MAFSGGLFLSHGPCSRITCDPLLPAAASTERADGSLNGAAALPIQFHPVLFLFLWWGEGYTVCVLCPIRIARMDANESNL